MPKNTSRCPDGPDEMKTHAESEEKRRVDEIQMTQMKIQADAEKKDLDPDGKD